MGGDKRASELKIAQALVDVLAREQPQRLLVRSVSGVVQEDDQVMITFTANETGDRYMVTVKWIA